MVREREVQSQSWKKNEYYRHTSAAKKLKKPHLERMCRKSPMHRREELVTKKLKNAVAKFRGKGSR